MDVPPVSINNFSYLQSKWRTPKAGVSALIDNIPVMVAVLELDAGLPGWL